MAINTFMNFNLININLLSRRIKHGNLTLTGKLMIAVLIAFIVLCSGNYLISYRTLESNVVKNVLISINQSSKLINAAVASAANEHGNNLQVLQTYLTEMLNPNDTSGIVYITVVRANGTVIMHAGAPQETLPIPDTPDHYNKAAKRGMIHIRNDILLENNEIGFMQYGIATSDLMDAMEQSQRNSLLLTTIVISVSFVALALFGLHITRQLSTLKLATQEIAAGHYELRMLDKGDDELSDVAHNFNLMSEAVESKVREISTLNQELEQRVQHRTEDIQTANKQLEDNLKELKETRQSLLKSEKLASLGSIVAGITHEINTPIGNALVSASTVTAAVEEFSNKIAQGKVSHSTLQQFLDQCKEGSRIVEISLVSATELIQSFKQVAVDQSSERRRKFNLAQTIQETITTLNHTFKNSPYKLTTNIPDNIVMDSYPGALGQIISNLLANALMHAFDGKDNGQMQINAELFAPNWVRISFTDDGNGISVGHVARIFDPFFTTKFGQGGSGLGLNVVDNITHRILGGKIDVASQVGFGTLFKIDIPLTAPVVTTNDLPFNPTK